MNEVVKYNNDMNLLKFKGFTKTDMNLLMVFCSKTKDKNTERITLAFEEIKELANFTSTDKKDFILALEGMIQRLMKVNSKIITNNKIYYFVLFPTFIVDEAKEELTIAVNKDFTFLLNELKVFTKFELNEFIDLDSKYSKNFYRLLKQYRTTGVLQITDIETFREKMDCPTSYSNKRFYERVIKVAIKELQEKELFKNLVCTPKKAKKRGSPVIGYTFTFMPEKAKGKPKEVDQVQDQVQKPKQDRKKTGGMTQSAIGYNDYPQRDYNQEMFDKLEEFFAEQQAAGLSE